MSEVYIKEPNTSGKAVFQTTHGDLEIELWATECPKACRNFCQLILEGYYNGTIFHRVMKDFLVQGGDPSGTGDGLESIYGEPYPDEIHPRLKFRYRGMMGVASAGKGTKTNGSQFFIVMNRAPTLDGKHTLFAKVVGQTVYNLVRISDTTVDKRDRPVDPPRILRAELTWDPFGDLEPRRIAAPPMQPSITKEVHRRAPVKNKKVLSFAEGEDSDDDDDAPEIKKGGAHDLLKDERLKKEAAYSEEKRRIKEAPGKRAAESSGGSKAAKRPAPARAAESRKAEPEADYGGGSDSDDSDDSDQEDDVAVAKSRKRQEEINALKRGIAKVGEEPEEVSAKKKVGSLLAEQRAGYQTRHKVKITNRADKKKQDTDMMAVMKSFQDRLRKTFDTVGNDDSEEEEEKEESPVKKGKEKEKGKGDETKQEGGSLSQMLGEGEDEEGFGKGWLKSSGLKFHTSGDKAFKLAQDKAKETLSIFDPLLAEANKTGNSEILAAEMKKRSKGMVAPSRRKDNIQELWKKDQRDYGDPRTQRELKAQS